MFTNLLDKICPPRGDFKVGDRVTINTEWVSEQLRLKGINFEGRNNLIRYGTIIDTCDKNYTIVQWDNDNKVVHPTKELKLTRKRKI
jgi:hypothetical protein